jgi:hypothetical protein
VFVVTAKMAAQRVSSHPVGNPGAAGNPGMVKL